MLKHRVKRSSFIQGHQVQLEPPANFCPVLPKANLSCLKITLICIVLTIFTLSCWAWLVMLFYETVSSTAVYGSMYCWLFSTYCVLVSLYTLRHLFGLSSHGPTKLCRLGMVMLFLTFIEYLIFTSLFLTVQTDDLPGYHFQIKSNIILSLVRFVSALITYFLLRIALSDVAWDVGDPIQ